MPEVIHPVPRIDPDKNQIITVLGRKGSGKSVWAHTTFRGWPGLDKLVIDPTGDADPGADLGTVTLRGGKVPHELPLPKHRGEHTVTRYIGDPFSATWREDLDRALGMALFPKDRRTLTWVDESGDVFPVNKIGRNARTMLHQSRHWYASLILAAPRPISLDPLTLAQADHVIMYDLPHPHDRERIAGAIGIKPRVLAAELDRLRSEPAHSYLWYVAAEHQLYLCPPVPMDRSYRHAQASR